MKSSSRLTPVLLILGLTFATTGCSSRKSTSETVQAKPQEAVPEAVFEVASEGTGEVLSGDLPMGDQAIPLQSYQDPELPWDGEGLAGTAPASAPGSLPPEVLALLEDVHFEFDSYRLSPEAREQLVGLGAYLRQNRDFGLLVEGHCDERGDAAYNMALGEKRALTVREFLAGTRVEPRRILTVSYGEERPVSPGHDEAAWALNRCARFRLRRP